MVHMLLLKIHCNRNINDKLQQYENEVRTDVFARGGAVLCYNILVSAVSHPLH